LASVTLRRTFDKWVTMGRGLQLLRKADQIGTRNAFNDLRDVLQQIPPRRRQTCAGAFPDRDAAL
jgi:hypothetical protein